jgi:uracil-DNA glycosylase family 4
MAEVGRFVDGRLADVHHAIVSCERCPRLREYCGRVASEKKRAYREDTYWGRPVPGFGDPQARLLLIGLAPAAHGANRTGRVFTGDGTGGSGDFLMAALHAAGFANQTTSTHAKDGLRLSDAFISMAVRCAPPDNTPLPEELARCLDHLDDEVSRLPRAHVVVALGKIAFDAWLQILKRRGVTLKPRPQFGHGAMVDLAGDGRDRKAPLHGAPPRFLLGCYHPSRQNTNTGKLTPGMMAAVFKKAKKLLREELREDPA